MIVRLYFLYNTETIYSGHELSDAVVMMPLLF